MKMKKLAAPFLALLLCAALLAGCGAPAASSVSAPAPASGAPSSEAAPGPVRTGDTFTDMAGREIALDGPVQRVVALQPSDCEILYALGAEDLLVGRGEYCDYPEEVLEVTSVQSGSETNIEQVIALEPDVVLMTTMNQSEEQVKALEAAGARVVISDAADIAGVYESIRLIGAVAGKEDEAETLIAQMQAAFEGVQAKSDKDGSETVYFEVSPLEYGLWAAGSNTFMDELAGMLGLTNAFADVDGWGEISEEQVLERDPDYIVTVTMYFGDGPTPVEEIKGRAGWQNLKAVQGDRILNADSDEISRPGPRLADAAEVLYDFVYEGITPDAATESAVADPGSAAGSSSAA